MISEGLPRQLASETVILMQVVPGMREHDVGLDRLQCCENLLRISPRVGQEPVAKVVQLNV